METDRTNSSLAILQHGSAEHERQTHLARVKRIREQWGEIQIDLVRRDHVADHVEGGSTAQQEGIHVAELRAMLLRRGIVFSDWSFEQACKDHRCGRDRINSRTFLLQFHNPRTKPPAGGFGAVITESYMSVDQAVRLVREKINGRLVSDTGGLLAAFKFFDRDQGGTLGYDELKTGLTQYLGLRFDEPLLEKLLAKYDPAGTGEVDLHGFESRVMGSTTSDSTGFVDHVSQKHVSASNGNTELQVRVQIIRHARSHSVCKYQSCMV